MNALPPPIIEIKHEQAYKVTERHISPFYTIIDNLQAKEKKEREAKIKKDSDAKRKERERQKVKEINKRKQSPKIRKSGDERLKRENRTNRPVQSDAGRPSSSGSMEENTGTNEQELNNSLGATWDAVSPLQASEYMASKTGVSVDRWLAIIYAESTNNPYVTNSIGCYGYLQLHPVHGAVSQMTPQQYLDTAVNIANSPQGLSAWEVVTMGRA